MEERRVTKRLLDGNPGGSRSRGRPRVRWKEQVEEDLKLLGVSNYKRKAANRKEWSKILKEVKALQGL